MILVGLDEDIRDKTENAESLLFRVKTTFLFDSPQYVRVMTMMMMRKMRKYYTLCSSNRLLNQVDRH